MKTRRHGRARIWANNNNHVISYSPSNTVFSQPIGDIVEFKILPSGLNPGDYGLLISNAVLTSVVYAAQTSHVSCEIIKSGSASRRFFLFNSKIFFCACKWKNR